MKSLRTAINYGRMLMAGKPSKVEIAVLCLGAILAIISGVPFPLIGVLFGQLLNDLNGATCDQTTSSNSSTSASETNYQSSVDSRILIIVYLAIAQFVTIYGHLTCWSFYGSRLASKLREKYLENLLRQEPSYFDKLDSGEVAARLNGDIQAIRSGTAEKVGICLSAFSFFVTAYVVAFIKDWLLAAILISLIPAYFLMSFVGGYYIEKYAGLMSDHSATAASIASQALSNFMVVQAFGAKGRLEERFCKALKASEDEGIKKATAIGIQSGVLYFVAYAANGLAFWQGSRQVARSVSQRSGITVGDVFVVIFVLIEATLLLSQVAPFIHLFSAALASYEKLRSDIDRTSKIDGTASSGVHLKQVEGTFEFRNVSFNYPSRSEVTVLDQFSLKIPAKKHTAIVGLSGSGKSTIAGLASRLYDPDQGQIFFDNFELRELNTRDFRSHISLVQQEPSLLNRSILENIAHGLLNSSRADHSHVKRALLGSQLADIAMEVRNGHDLVTAAEKQGPEFIEIVDLVRRAARIADADTFISNLQQGYGTIVGSGGRLISGGQKQRIAIARALSKDPQVLILDEATAALDSTSEQNIQQAILSSVNDRTIITIAHRLSTITSADKVVVMDQGRIVEEGNHAELMAMNGTYARLVNLQTLHSEAQEKETPPSDDLTAQLKDLNEGVSFVSESLDVDEKAESTATIAPAAMQAEDTEEPVTPSKSVWNLVRGYAPALKPHTLMIFIALVGSSIVGAAYLAEAIIFGNTVGALSTCNTSLYIQSRGALFGLMFFVLAIVEFFANTTSWVGFGWVSERFAFKVRVLSFRSLFEQDLQWHQSEGRNPNMLLSYITRDGSAMAGLNGSIFGTLFSITVNLIAAIILTNIIAWKISLVCLALVPLLLGAGLMELRVLGKFEEKHESAFTESVGIGVEAINSIKTVASFGLEDEIISTYRRSLAEPSKDLLKVTIQASLFQAITYLLGNLVNALAYWWGAKRITAGEYTQTQFLIVVFSLLVSALLWSQMFALAPELSSAKGALARILGLIEAGSDGMRADISTHPLDKPADIEAMVESKTAYNPSGQPSSVELRDIHFCYPARPDVKVLKGLNLKIEPGQFCALVGPSGAGKSTIISLVERMYTPERGSVLINNADVTSGREVTFRDDIALVPQESVLFEGTVEFNVGLGAKPGTFATMSDIEEACKLANIHETIVSLPDGYQTLCGPNGNQFSGGQKQRLSIARALVRKPKLLILDEPTSALDAESERLLQDGLDMATKHITVIAIAHRLHTIRKADVIFLMEGGQCVAQGKHEELLLKSTSYRKNVMHQTVSG